MSTIDLNKPAGAACAVHPDRPSVGICDNCGAYACDDCLGDLRGRAICRACVEGGRVRLGDNPWEDRAQRGWPRAMVEMVWAMTVRPTEVFDGTDPAEDIGGPLLYVAGLAPVLVLLSLPNNLLQQWVLFPLIGLEPEPTGIALIDAMQNPLLMAPFQLVLSPLMAVIVVLFYGLLAHLGLMIVGGARADLSASLKAVAYSYSVVIWGALPVIGLPVAFIAGLWNLVLIGIGLSRLHGVELWKGLFGSLWLVALCCVCLGGVFGLAFLGALAGA